MRNKQAIFQQTSTTNSLSISFRNVCFCGVLIESVILLFKAQSVLFCMVACETEVDIIFWHLAFGVPLHPGTLDLPIFSSITIQLAVASRHTSETWMGVAGPLLFFPSYSSAIVELGWSLLHSRLFFSSAQAFCDIQLECVKLNLFLFSYASAVAISPGEQPGSHDGFIDKV